MTTTPTRSSCTDVAAADLDARWYDLPIAEYHADDDWREHLIESKDWGPDMVRAIDAQAWRQV